MKLSLKRDQKCNSVHDSVVTSGQTILIIMGASAIWFLLFTVFKIKIFLYLAVIFGVASLPVGAMILFLF